MKNHELIKDTRPGRSGEYYARIQVGGVRKRFVLSRNKREAEEKLRALEKDVFAGKIPFTQQTTLIVNGSGSRDMRIEELAVKHLEWVRANRTEGTFNNRKLFVNQFLEFIRGYMPQGSCMVSQINRPTLTDFHAWARTNHGRGANAGNEALVGVKALFNWAVENEVCDHSIKAFPKIRREPATTRRFKDNELPRLMQVLPEDFTEMIEFGLLTGVRPEELRTVKKDEILNTGTRKIVHIEHHKTSKTARSHKPRSVPLCKRAEEIINHQFKLHPKSEYVFLNTDGLPYTKSALFHRLQRWCKKIGIHGMPYSLRHTFGTKQGHCKTNQAVLSQIMGHTSLQTTARYMENNSESHIQAVDDMEKSIESILSNGSQDAKPMQKWSQKWSRTKKTNEKTATETVASH